LAPETISKALFAPIGETEGLPRCSQIDRETKLLRITGCSAVW
jgi:hypothetical protein